MNKIQSCKQEVSLQAKNKISNEKNNMKWMHGQTMNGDNTKSRVLGEPVWHNYGLQELQLGLGIL